MSKVKSGTKSLLLALVSGISMISAHAYQSEPVVPQYNTKDYAVYVYYVGDEDNHKKTYLFGSDGQYCYLQMVNHKYQTVGGHWKQQDNNIEITYHAPKRTFFGLWNDWRSHESPVIDVQNLANGQGFDGEPFLLGFGNDTPNKLAVFNPKIHVVHQVIPKDVNYVFVGENNKTKDGYTLTAFSLENMSKINTGNKENAYVLSLATTFNTLSDKEIAKLPKTLAIQDNILKLDEKPVLSFISNDTNTDVISMSNSLKECQGSNPLSGLKQYYENFSKTPQEKAILPFLEPNSQIIHYQGNIDNGAWLRRQ